MDRANLGLLLAALTGLLDDRTRVVCVTGPDGRRLDSITVTRPEPHLRGLISTKETRRAARIPPAVILKVLSIAIELAAEGREARPVGSLFVVGDTPHVLRFAHQLVLNPFRGYARHIRSVLDPSLTETIKEFAVIDGAFIVRADGTVHSAGTYLMPKTVPVGLPSGLGTRHQTAAAITSDTQAMAITVSQSTGTVTVFRDGAVAFTLERAAITRW
jgi:DNA integrity scanning protein DisA with diadenylate cyclase activity